MTEYIVGMEINQSIYIRNSHYTMLEEISLFNNKFEKIIYENLYAALPLEFPINSRIFKIFTESLSYL